MTFDNSSDAHIVSLWNMVFVSLSLSLLRSPSFVRSLSLFEMELFHATHADMCVCVLTFFFLLRYVASKDVQCHRWIDEITAHEKKENNLLTTYIYIYFSSTHIFGFVLFFFIRSMCVATFRFFMVFFSSFSLFFLNLFLFCWNTQGQICNGSSCNA